MEALPEVLYKNKKYAPVSVSGGVLYISAARKHFIPAYVYFLLEHFNCTEVSFGISKKTFKKEDLKGKEDWNELK